MRRQRNDQSAFIRSGYRFRGRPRHHQARMQGSVFGCNMVEKNVVQPDQPPALAKFSEAEAEAEGHRIGSRHGIHRVFNLTFATGGANWLRSSGDSGASTASCVCCAHATTCVMSATPASVGSNTAVRGLNGRNHCGSVHAQSSEPWIVAGS